MTERISIALASYNGERYLQAQLDSFTAQTRPPDEVVICDDGSTDGTPAILQRFRTTAPFDVQIVRSPENIGHVRNFEKALGLCTGDLIFLSDQDDVWLPQKLATVAGLFQGDPGRKVVTTDAAITDAALHPSGATKLGQVRKLGFSPSYFRTGCCSACRRDFIGLALPFPTGIAAHDVWLNALADDLGCRFISDAVLQLYRRHGRNISDDITSSLAGVSSARHHLSHGLAPAVDGWQQQVDELRFRRDRLAARAHVLEGPPGAFDLATALRHLDARIDMFGFRIAICHEARHKRLARVLAKYRAGGYDLFSGWKSAVKDVIRR